MQQDYLKNRQAQLNNKVTDFYTPTGIHVYFQSPVENIDVEKIVEKAESTIPQHLLGEVEMIIFGHFDEFEERSINAFYKDNAIYISPFHENAADLFDDIVHEIAHSTESQYGYHLYADKKMENEFLRKREHLYNILWNTGFRAPKTFFLDTEFNQEFDDFLYKQIGYDKLAYLMSGIFISPYAATSLREYFATGFTEFYLDSNHDFIKKTSPELFRKILMLQDPKNLD